MLLLSTSIQHNTTFPAFSYLLRVPASPPPFCCTCQFLSHPPAIFRCCEFDYTSIPFLFVICTQNDSPNECWNGTFAPVTTCSVYIAILTMVCWMVWRSLANFQLVWFPQGQIILISVFHPDHHLWFCKMICSKYRYFLSQEFHCHCFSFDCRCWQGRLLQSTHL